MAEKNLIKKESAKQYLGFFLNEKEFYFPISLIEGIVEVPKITRLPNSQSYVEGVINFRGQIMPVIDTQKRLNLGEVKKTSQNRVVIVRCFNRLLGFIVDSVKKVLEIPDKQIESTSDMFLNKNERQFSKGICKVSNDSIAILLDIPKILEMSQSSDNV